MVLTDYLKWNTHVDKITTKASQRIYLLKQLKQSGLDESDLICFYVACIRSVLEYACQVFHYCLPQYLSDKLERIQKRSMNIIFPGLTYEHALELSTTHTLLSLRENLCRKLFNDIVKDENHKLHSLLPNSIPHNLWLKKHKTLLYSKIPYK